jgi:hypothetical protein
MDPTFGGGSTALLTAARVKAIAALYLEHGYDSIGFRASDFGIGTIAQLLARVRGGQEGGGVSPPRRRAAVATEDLGETQVIPPSPAPLEDAGLPAGQVPPPPPPPQTHAAILGEPLDRTCDTFPLHERDAEPDSSVPVLRAQDSSGQAGAALQLQGGTESSERAAVALQTTVPSPPPCGGYDSYEDDFF